MTAKRRQEAVLRGLRREPLATVPRQLRGEADEEQVLQTVFLSNAADQGGWRDAFLEAGAASPESRPRDDRIAQLSERSSPKLRRTESRCRTGSQG